MAILMAAWKAASRARSAEGVEHDGRGRRPPWAMGTVW